MKKLIVMWTFLFSITISEPVDKETVASHLLRGVRISNHKTSVKGKDFILFPGKYVRVLDTIWMFKQNKWKIAFRPEDIDPRDVTELQCGEYECTHCFVTTQHPKYSQKWIHILGKWRHLRTNTI